MAPRAPITKARAIHTLTPVHEKVVGKAASIRVVWIAVPSSRLTGSDGWRCREARGVVDVEERLTVVARAVGADTTMATLEMLASFLSVCDGARGEPGSRRMVWG